MNYAVGIDVGGTNIKGLAITPTGEVLAQLSVPTGDDGTSAWIGRVVEVWQQLRLNLGAGPACTGIAAPGLAAADQLSIHCMPGRLPGLVGLNWQSRLGVAQPVPVLNDAHAALLGEVWCGAARGLANVILLTLGTGVGGAVLVEGRLLRGELGRAGHLGHVSLNPHGPLDIASTPGSLEDAIGECTLFRRSAGQFPSTAALVAASREGNPVAQEVWLRSIQALAAAVASFINCFDPARVVLGGGIAAAGPVLFEPLQEYLDRFEWRPTGVAVPVVPAGLGDRAAAYGAAWNALRFSA